MAHREAGSEAVAITVNGDRREIPAASTIASLLASLELDPHVVVIERNREILRDREAYATIGLEPDDTIEIVHFVGGG